MKDEIYLGPTKPDKEPFYSVFQDKDGKLRYYEHNLEFLYRYIGVYGKWEGKWSYTCQDADTVFTLAERSKTV